MLDTVMKKTYCAIRWPEIVSNFPAICFAIAMLGLIGCSDRRSDLAAVSGVVTLDGAPLPRATLVFQPDAAGPASYGLTDEDGRYTLMYDQGVEGAVIGMHTVKITTFRERDPYADPPITAAPEILPPRYYRNSELRVEVVRTKMNRLDFSLRSQP